MSAPVPVSVPVLPESAPFTAEQRAYLNGFLAGLFSRAPAGALPGVTGGAGAPTAPADRALAPLTVLVGSQTGRAEQLAKRMAKESGKRGFAPTIRDLGQYAPEQLGAETHVIVVTSTYGDGDPPDNAKGFWEFLSGAGAPRLDRMRFSVCALGDSSYPKFCAFGKAVDERLEKLGASRIHPRADCDVDGDEIFSAWMDKALAGFRSSEAGSAGGEGRGGGGGAGGLTNGLPPIASEREKGGAEAVKYSRSNPFQARLQVNRRLNGPGSAKDVRHLEIALPGSSLPYDVGDALGVIPKNDPALVDEIVAALGASGDESVPGPSGPVPFRGALMCHYEITRIAKPVLEAFAARTNDPELLRVTSPAANGELTRFLWGREIIDLFHAFPKASFTPAEFIGCLRKLAPRLYSISSSPKAHPGEVHLTVGTVRYESFGRPRSGVCSTFLADRVGPETPVPVFVHQNNAFRPPSSESPLIMVGPGTGIAPFRAFLEERRAIGATGRNWLIFGDQKSSCDFLYGDEMEAYRRDGLLTRLDLAWSRDQAGKVYVQQRMMENAVELFAWLEAGAGFYVCGDASRMAKDVDAALHQVIQAAGGRSADDAAAYVAALRKDQRYRRDVY